MGGLFPWRPEGGLPPLADGAGMGDGECDGSVIRGLGIAMGADEVALGAPSVVVLWDTLGEDSGTEPN